MYRKTRYSDSDNRIENELCIEHIKIIPCDSREAIYNRIKKKSFSIQNDCIIYAPKYLCKQGYAQICIGGKGMHQLHRVVWWIFNTEYTHVKDIPSTLQIRHLCKNKTCINIEHYKSGDAFDNANDKYNSGTQTSGEAHHSSKITLDTAQKIADSWTSGQNVNRRAIKFDVKYAVVASIDKRETWKDVIHPNGKEYIGMKEKNRLQRLNAKNNTVDYKIVREGILKRSVETSTNNVHTGTPCREWIKDYTKTYPRVSFFGHTQDAHIWSLQSKLGRKLHLDSPITRHLCSNQRCVKYEHLEEGTHQDNMNDSKIHRRNLQKNER